MRLLNAFIDVGTAARFVGVANGTIATIATAAQIHTLTRWALVQVVVARINCAMFGAGLTIGAQFQSCISQQLHNIIILYSYAL